MLPFNREWRRLARAGDRDGLRRFLAPERDRLYADPLGAWRAIMASAPKEDQDIMSDAEYQLAFARGMTEALRPGVDGWVDEGFLIMREWSDFDARSIRSRITWWHGERDRNAPVSAVRRLIEGIPMITLTVWGDAGHLAGYRREPEILDELLARSAGPSSRSR
jgi:pimeloyl-ACP methyl ester carboxylesterase